MAYGPDEFMDFSGPGVTWYNSNMLCNADVQVDYLCNIDVGTHYTCTYKGNAGGVGVKGNRAHQFTAEECGGALPQGQCLVAQSRTGDCGVDEDWAAYGPGETGGPGVSWWNGEPCAANADVKVDYLCNIDAGTFHTCSFDSGPGGVSTSTSRRHQFTAEECGGALPQGQCLVALRRTAQNGKDEDWKAYGPGESGHYGSGPGVMWENPDFPTPHLTNVKVDYFCKGR